MADTQTQTKKDMTAAEAAKAVRRPVTRYIDGKDAAGKATKVPKIEYVAVEAKEVLSFKDYGSHVVVVTKDGQKFSSADA
ncbi:MAG TPA: hypothetical protein VLK85_19990 [Ramlibacter sp.]|nr:hypothetical protein [Ramlibacter sp.]